MDSHSTDSGVQSQPLSPAALARVGETIANKYCIERFIGEGGMGVVMQAMHLQLDERVALKFLRHDLLCKPEVVARFEHEARAAVKLRSEHVARVYDVGTDEDGTPFIVMEYLEGRNLADCLKVGGPLPVEQAAEYVIQACDGLADAHAHGIVHRDVKPDNLFLVEAAEGWKTIKILDFGISKAALQPHLLDAAGPVGNLTVGLAGTPFYMAPEQVRLDPTVDRRIDIWALGVVLFELLTGITPFASTMFAELTREILDTPHRSLLSLRPRLPTKLGAIIDRCLQKDRAKRFSNTAELAMELLNFAPQRARGTVEHIIAVSRSAGFLTDVAVDVPAIIRQEPLLSLSVQPISSDPDADASTSPVFCTSPAVDRRTPGFSKKPATPNQSSLGTSTATNRAKSQDRNSSVLSASQSTQISGGVPSSTGDRSYPRTDADPCVAKTIDVRDAPQEASSAHVVARTLNEPAETRTKRSSMVVQLALFGILAVAAAGGFGVVLRSRAAASAHVDPMARSAPSAASTAALPKPVVDANLATRADSAQIAPSASAASIDTSPEVSLSPKASSRPPPTLVVRTASPRQKRLVPEPTTQPRPRLDIEYQR